MNDHRPIDWYARGVYPSCSCGFNPRDNRLLNEHWAALGFRYVGDRDRVVREDL